MHTPRDILSSQAVQPCKKLPRGVGRKQIRPSISVSESCDLDNSDEQGYDTGYSMDYGLAFASLCHPSVAGQADTVTGVAASAIMLSFSGISDLSKKAARIALHSPMGTPGGSPIGLAVQAVARALASVACLSPCC